MIAIGTDIVEIERIETVWQRHGARFVERILTPAEIARCHENSQPWRYLAKRFAAKEAIAKSLGTGIGVELSWQDMTVLSDDRGAPMVQLSPRGGAVAARRGGSSVVLSIADERAYAVAFAVLLA